MLSMTVRSFLRDPVRPVVFVPVYFGYERLVEGRTYITELSGRPKEKESVLGLLKSWRVLRERFGKVYVNLGEPIALEGILDRHCQAGVGGVSMTIRACRR
jgi:glycerol-3-phosphate O-acyltransferase